MKKKLGSIWAGVRRMWGRALLWIQSILDFLRKGIPFVLLCIGVILALIGNGELFSAESANMSAEKKAQWNAFRDIGLALVTGGVVAVVVDAFKYTGVFRTAISDVMVEDAFLARRSDLEDVWVRVTEQITGKRFPDLKNHIYTEVLGKYLPTKEDFYYENYVRTIAVDWKKGSNSILSVKEEIHLDVIPTSPEATIPFYFSFAKSAGAEHLPDKKEWRLLKRLWVDGSLVLKNDKKVKGATGKCSANSINIRRKGIEIKCTINLQGKSKYKVHRIMHREFDPTLDPIQNCFSNRFIRGARIIVQCVPDDLTVRFIELGTLHDFDRIVSTKAVDPSRKGDIAREYPPDKLLFPKQGYALCYQKVDKSKLDKKHPEEHDCAVPRESKGEV